MFHSSLFISGVLYNLKSLMKINKGHINQLISCQKDLLVKIFDCPPTVPLEALFIDSCIIPIQLTLIGRRIMYFWCLLQIPESELVKMVLMRWWNFLLMRTLFQWYDKICLFLTSTIVTHISS